MRRQTKTALAFALLLAAPTAFAQDKGGIKNQEDTTKVIKIERNKKSPVGRPEMPSQQHIECLYADGTLHFFFAIPEGECLVTVTDSFSGMSTQHSFDSAEPAEVYVGEIQTGCIEIQTENGHQYTGIIE